MASSSRRAPSASPPAIGPIQRKEILTAVQKISGDLRALSSTRNYDELVKSLIAKLEALAVRGAKAEQEEKAATDLRAFIKLKQATPPLSSAYWDSIFEIQQLLATYWPLDEHGNLQETTIPFDQRIPSSRGRVYRKSTLQRLLKNHRYSQLVEQQLPTEGKDTKIIFMVDIHDDHRISFNQRDLAYFKSKGIEATGSQGLSKTLLSVGNQLLSLSLSFNVEARKSLRILLGWLLHNRPLRALAWTLLIGCFIGCILGFLATAGLVLYGAFAFMPPLAIPFVFALSALCGFFQPRSHNVLAFWKGFVLGALGIGTLFSIFALGPAVIAGLGAVSLLSSASVASTTAIWVSSIGPLAPLALGLVASLVELFKPNLIESLLYYPYNAVLYISVSLSVGVCALVSGTLGLLASFADSLFSCCCRREPPSDLTDPITPSSQAQVLSEISGPAHKKKPGSGTRPQPISVYPQSHSPAAEIANQRAYGTPHPSVAEPLFPPIPQDSPPGQRVR